MGVLIKVDFKNKTFEKILTKGELDTIGKRIDEIENTLDLCADGFDEDIVDNLERELDELTAILENSLKNTIEYEKSIKAL